jgi:hypothetical protein
MTKEEKSVGRAVRGEPYYASTTPLATPLAAIENGATDDSRCQVSKAYKEAAN